MYNTILLDVKDRVATLTVNRPAAGNAYVLETYTEVRLALEACGQNPDVGAVIITGAGKLFSAGGDIVEFKGLLCEKEPISVENVSRAAAMAMAVRKCPKPVIAMVNGAAAGAGCSLALACDFRIVSPGSKLVLAFINLGLSGDTGAMWNLVHIAGIAKATEMLMLGEAIGGEEALRCGLATRLVPDEQLAEKTWEFAQKLAAKPAVALAKQKEMFLQFYYKDIEEYTKMESAFMRDTSQTQDFAEAVHAFLEKRKPVFKGR